MQVCHLMNKFIIAIDIVEMSKGEHFSSNKVLVRLVDVWEITFKLNLSKVLSSKKRFMKWNAEVNIKPKSVFSSTSAQAYIKAVV